MIYAGIGSRRTPPEFLTLMSKLGFRLAHQCHTCRSGHAVGADQAFELGASEAISRGSATPSQLEVYLPWSTYNADVSHLGLTFNPEPAAFKVADEYIKKAHPAYNKLSHGAKKLHGRNVFQALGGTFDKPVDFVVCWTPDGAETLEQLSSETGGTSTAIRISIENGAKVFNLYHEDSIICLKNFIGVE